MRELAVAFPRAILIFATLNESLSFQEIELIASLATAERRKHIRGQPYSSVIVLTGVELFSSYGFGNCWKGRGGLYKQFNENYFDFSNLELVSEATCQLYLGLEPWHAWSEGERKKRNERRAAST
jgi:hypothetical protein